MRWETLLKILELDGMVEQQGHGGREGAISVRAEVRSLSSSLALRRVR
jgi:hypothetical protein